MKEIECGAKLKKVQCNDRSRPLLPKTKAKDQFIYESEKSNMHNQLLKQIEGGVRLKKVKCNDRSRPVLDGLRKFRRQMTVEEQMQKTEATEELAEEPELDDLDDIDRVRDDLQSTKQMLALELRNKEAMERENKRLLARLLNLEAELEAERSRKSAPEGGGQAAQPLGAAPGSDKLVAKLKEENEAQQQVAKEMEARYHQAAEELDSTKAQLQEALFQKKQAEKQLKEIEDGLVEGGRALQKQLSKKLISSRSGDIRKQMSQARLNELRKQSIPMAEADREDSESEYTDETVTDSEEEEEEDLSNDPEAQERRVQRELKLLATKLKAFKDKEASARRERTALREQLKLQQKALREERAKYKSLQKEVDKMAKLLKEDDDEGEEEDEEEEDEEEEEEESEESETEEEEDAEGSGDELPADAPVDDKRNNLNNRTRRHEGILGALKKGNYLLKANIDRVKDDLSKHREMSLMLQEDLNSVLAELG